MGGTFSCSSNATSVPTFSKLCQNYNDNNKKQQENLFDISAVFKNSNLSSFK